jgi:hypothetical protein
LKTVERRPDVSSWVMICATLASAVGETKLALSAMVRADVAVLWRARETGAGLAEKHKGPGKGN